jgi:hypothetical protein
MRTCWVGRRAREDRNCSSTSTALAEHVACVRTCWLGGRAREDCRVGKNKNRRGHGESDVRDVLLWKQKAVGAFEHPPRNISHDGWACTMSCLSMTSDCHRPKRHVVSESTWAHKRAIASATQSEQALTSEAEKPSWGPRAATHALSLVVMSQRS